MNVAFEPCLCCEVPMLFSFPPQPGTAPLCGPCADEVCPDLDALWVDLGGGD